MSEDKTTKKSQTKRNLLILLIIIVVFCYAKIHILYGKDFVLPTVVLKDTIGLSETFIDVDMILEMPSVSAWAKYPIGKKKLDEYREEYSYRNIESQKEREARVKKEYEELQERINNYSDLDDDDYVLPND